MQSYYTVLIICILNNIISIPLKAEEGIEIPSKQQGVDYVAIVSNEPKVKIVQIKNKLFVLRKGGYDLCSIDPNSRRLVPNIELQRGGKDIAVVRHFFKRPYSPPSSIRFFDIHMKPTTCHGFHESRVEYRSWHSSPNLQSFFDEKGHPTLMDGQVAFIDYTRVFFFPDQVFISFLNKEKQAVVWDDDGHKIIWMWFDLSASFKGLFLCAPTEGGLPTLMNTLAPQEVRHDTAIIFALGLK